MIAFLNSINYLDRSHSNLKKAVSMATMQMVDAEIADIFFEEDLGKVDHLVQELEICLNRLRAKAQVMEHFVNQSANK